jgi:signal transduction histidine kinase
MYATNTSIIKKWVMRGLQPHSPRARLAIVLGATVLYFASFRQIIDAVGSLGIELVAVPVALAGWYFGIAVGVLASLTGNILVLLFFIAMPGYGLDMWISSVPWPGNLMVVTVGYIAGLLRQGLDQRYQIEMELRARERYFAIINHMTQDILALKNSDDMFYRLATHLTNLFVADYAYLTHWDPTRDQTTLIATTLYLDQSSANLVLSPAEAAVVLSVLKSEKVLVIEDVSTSGYTINPGSFKQLSLPTRSALCIPIIIQEFKFGSALIAFDTPRRFTPEEIRRAEEVGKQMALGIRTIQQEAEIQQQLKEAYALAKIEQSLSETQRVSLSHVLQLIVDSARELLPGTEQAVIHMLDDEHQVLIPQAVSGFEGPSAGQLNMQLGQGVAGQVIEAGEVVSIADVDSDSRFLPQNQPARFRSLMVAPVQSGEKRLGTISVQSGQPKAFSPGQQSLLRSLGTQAAIAIENARLLETTQQGLKEVNALYHITQGMAGSLETRQLMQDVVDLLQQNFGYYLAEVFVIDPENEDLVVQHASGKIGELLKSQRLSAGAGIIGHAAETGKPFFTNEVDKIVFFVPHPLLPDTQSELAVPIKAGNRVLGVLDIQQCPPALLTERDLQLVSTVADQLAVALQKASLYSDLQASLAQEKTMQTQLVQSERLALVGRLLASVSHELNNPLQAIQNALFLLKEERGISEQGKQDLQIVLSEAERMAALIERLRTSYRPTREGDFQLIQLNNVVEDISTLVATHLRHNQIAFEFHSDPDLPLVLGLPDQLRQVTLNLLMNAVEAMSTGGCLSVSTEANENREVILSVSDTGPGIDPALLPHIFDAFVTSKESGTGLGLTITYDIIHRHNGRITARNNDGGGATFSFWLPVPGKVSS